MRNLASTLRQMTLIVGLLTLTGSAFGQAGGDRPASATSPSKASAEPSKGTTPPGSEPVVKATQAIRDPIAVEAFAKLSVTDQFEELRKYRTKLVYAVQTLTNKLQRVDAQMKDSLQLKKDLEEQISVSTPLPERDYLQRREKELNDDISANEQKVADPQKYNVTSDQVASIKSTIEESKNELNTVKAYLTNYDERKTKSNKDKEDVERRKDATENLINDLKRQQDEGTSDLSLLNRQLADADEKIASLFGRTDASNDFRKIMSSVFAGLVALVIIGFFVIAVVDETVRRAIFSSESGIQFLTLFALVIAIILFGIVQVLEGKELAALLGGLSGYILGRGSKTS